MTKRMWEEQKKPVLARAQTSSILLHAEQPRFQGRKRRTLRTRLHGEKQEVGDDWHLSFLGQSLESSAVVTTFKSVDDFL